MSGYYAQNPHYAPSDFSEDAERLERAEERAGRWFADATKEQRAVFDRAMTDLRGLDAPRYDRAREAAKRVFDATTTAARELCELTVSELMLTGEVSEALSYRWDELAVSGALPSYEEALQDPAKARALFDASKGGNVRGITEDHRFALAEVFADRAYLALTDAVSGAMLEAAE